MPRLTYHLNNNIDIVLCTHFPFADYVNTRIISYKADISINNDLFLQKIAYQYFEIKGLEGKIK